LIFLDAACERGPKERRHIADTEKRKNAVAGRGASGI